MAEDGRFFERFLPLVRRGFSMVYSSTEAKGMLFFSREFQWKSHHRN